MGRRKKTFSPGIRGVLIQFCLNYKGWDINRVCEELHYGRSKAYDVLKNPEKLTVSDIHKITYGVTLSDLQFKQIINDAE